MLPTSGLSYHWRLGDIEITRVLEFEAALFEPTVIHPDVTAEIIERHRLWLEPRLLNPDSGLKVFAFHSTVIRTPRATILVDTCSGNDKERLHKQRYYRKNWPYLANLATAGFAPEDIDYVLCTHLHADHVGWNTRLVDGRWVPTFPNARYLFARQEWEHWERAELRARYTTDPYYEDSLLPVMDSSRAQLVASDYAFDDSVWIEPWPGHTPGHVCVNARSPQGSVIMSGDIMHTALRCAEPQLNSCLSKRMATKTGQQKAEPTTRKSGKLFGYARVSTMDQDLALQREALEGVGVNTIFEEKASGARRDGRTELQKVLSVLGEGDALVVMRLDRLGRSIRDLANIAHEIELAGAHLKVIEQSVDTSTAAGRAFYGMLAVFAAFETDVRRERQLEGIAMAKRQGVYEGGKPRLDRQRVMELSRQGLGPAAIARELGMARSSVYRLHREAGASHASQSRSPQPRAA